MKPLLRLALQPLEDYDSTERCLSPGTDLSLADCQRALASGDLFPAVRVLQGANNTLLHVGGALDFTSNSPIIQMLLKETAEVLLGWFARLNSVVFQAQYS